MRFNVLLIATTLAITACSPEPDPVPTVPARSSESASAPALPTTTPEPVADPTTSTEAPASTTTTESLAPLQSLAYEEFAVGLDFPIFLTPLPGTDLMVIATKEGQLWLHDGIDLHGEPFLDIRDAVYNRGERGLLGVAFSPDYHDSGRFFVHYSAKNDTVLSEFTAEGLFSNSASENVVFTVSQPATNYNGGMIEFSPDGFLYMGLGDGGRSRDRFGNGQNGETPLGALLRFDTSTPGVAVPAGSTSFGAPEVWSIGLRNPWRFSIDGESGRMFIGDVGQDNFEEISVAVLSKPDVNYGWPITEGLHCFSPSSGCDIEGLTLPVIEIEHGESGTCSVTGGVVYRGEAIPELDGYYLFSDFCGGYLRGFPTADADVAVTVTDWTAEVGRLDRVSSFGVDAAGEVYVISADGTVYKLVAVRG